MLILDTATRTVQVDLGGAVTTNELDMVASFVDIGAPDVYEPGTEVGVTSGGTAVELVAAPAAGRKRQLKFMTVFNNDTVAAEVRIFLDDNGTEYNLFLVTLPVGAHIIYTDGEGFRVIDTDGNSLVTANP